MGPSMQRFRQGLGEERGSLELVSEEGIRMGVVWECGFEVRGRLRRRRGRRRVWGGGRGLCGIETGRDVNLDVQSFQEEKCGLQ